MYINRIVRVWLPYIRSMLRCELQLRSRVDAFAPYCTQSLAYRRTARGMERYRLRSNRVHVPFRPYYRVLSSKIRQERVARNTGEYDGVHDADRCVPAIEMDWT